MLSTKELYERLEQTNDQHEHLHILFDIATSLLNTSEQRTLEVANQIKQLAEKLDNNLGRSYYHSTLGRVLYRQAKHEEVAVEFQKALDYSLLSNDKLTQAMCYDSLGIVYGSLGYYHKSLDTSLNALALYEQIDSKASHWQQISCYNNLGVIYKYLNRLQEAETCYHKGMALLAIAPNDKMRCNLAVNYGDVVLMNGRPEEALKYGMEALSGFKEHNHRIGESHAVLLIGKCYLSVGAFAKASQQFIAALKVSKDINNRAIEAEAYLGMGDIYMKMGGAKEAGEQYERTYKIAQEIANYSLQCQAACAMGKYCLAINKPEEALVYLSEGLALANEKHLDRYVAEIEAQMQHLPNQSLKAS